ncbi:NVEALA domain-containing protein [Viscerimonas tarda]
MKNKKKITGSLAILVVAIVATLNFNLGVQNKGTSDILLANLEALAQDEFPGDPYGDAESLFKYRERCEYSYYKSEILCFSNYDTVESAPATTVECSGMGNLDCFPDTYYGNSSTSSIDCTHN